MELVTLIHSPLRQHFTEGNTYILGELRSLPWNRYQLIWDCFRLHLREYVQTCHLWGTTVENYSIQQDIPRWANLACHTLHDSSQVRSPEGGIGILKTTGPPMSLVIYPCLNEVPNRQPGTRVTLFTDLSYDIIHSRCRRSQLKSTTCPQPRSWNIHPKPTTHKSTQMSPSLLFFPVYAHTTRPAPEAWSPGKLIDDWKRQKTNGTRLLSAPPRSPPVRTRMHKK